MKKLLKEGDIFLLKKGDSFYVKNFPKMFLYGNWDYMFNFEFSNGQIQINGIRRGLDTTIFIGEYVVTKINYDGGGDPDGAGTPYPDGHHVYAKRIIKSDDNEKKVSDFEINFYQTGSFACMIKNPKIIGKAKINYLL
jgi:hypothetical protein